VQSKSGILGLILRATHPDRVQVFHSGKAAVKIHGETSSQLLEGSYIHIPDMSNR